ncbi:hydrogenase maturation nickel metallochaperone HypA [Oscillibacter sp. MSJ-2]|uniref:Hydrogenase maturation nickel metallochaperone HypA n=1 Tax=Dysosmobacter acutus TaxID=2841504 RepID=A0ABS6FCI7_9FIRM|nr:hydrogenase maturation nickel metallochaperone HypA [Dysosmobacter acutus]MBU5627976.1 hydrogenase maturation nickel metallochaperone HypA [Dysosmobacter acutus]
MREVYCEECGKRYDYDVDDFCPRCGAYNAPHRSSTSAVRVDGLNERNHADSFVHTELHKEEKVRRRVGLEQPDRRIKKQPAPQKPTPQKETGKKEKQPGTAAVIVAVLVILQALLKMCAA